MADNTNNVLDEANSLFTARMYSEVAKEDIGKNVVMSGFSVMSPLSQLMLASVGESHDELLSVLGFPNDNVTKEVFTDVNSKLRAIKGVVLKSANKLYIPNGYELNEQFAAVSRDVFNSDVESVDFANSEETANEINAWVEEQTNHNIKELVKAESFDALTRGVLVNAIYFKGTWREKFDKQDTVDRDFHVTKDKTVKLPTMYISKLFQYAESAELDAKILELPYEGNQASFLIILPNEIDGLPALEEKLADPEILTKALDEMKSFEVDVLLPRFKIETEINLKDVLSKMGATRLFDEKEARLDNLLKGENDLYVSKAVQKAFIDVSEEGVEAAAANEFEIAVGALPPQYRRSFEADRPFYFLLKVGGVNVFTGRFVQ